MIRHDQQNNPLLRFSTEGLAKGELAVATRTPLAQGSTVLLQILTNTLSTSVTSELPQFQAQNSLR